MLTIQVCIGSACHLKGSYNVIAALQELVKKYNLDNDIEIKAAFCLGNCTKAVSVKIDRDPIHSVDMNTVHAFFSNEVLKKV